MNRSVLFDDQVRRYGSGVWDGSGPSIGRTSACHSESFAAVWGGLSSLAPSERSRFRIPSRRVRADCPGPGPPRRQPTNASWNAAAIFVCPDRLGCRQSDPPMKSPAPSIPKVSAGVASNWAEVLSIRSL